MTVSRQIQTVIFLSEDENDVHSLESSSDGEFIFPSDEEDKNDISEDSCSSDDEATPSSNNTNRTATSSRIGENLVSTCCERKCLMHLSVLDVFDSSEKYFSMPLNQQNQWQH